MREITVIGSPQDYPRTCSCHAYMQAAKIPAVQTLRVLVEEAEISACQQMLASRLQEAGEFKMPINCGFNGGHKDIPAYWFPKEKFWWGYEKIEGEAGARHCNAFGLKSRLITQRYTT